MKNKHLQIILNLFFGWFFLLFILSFSFNFNVIPDIGGYCSAVFEYLASATQNLFTDVEYLNYHSAEDNLGLYFNIFNLSILSLIFALISNKALSIRKTLLAIQLFKIIVRYYMILMLVFYGFDKVYKMQFSLPEPNIEYTRVKDLHTDILFWTTMGKSYSYSLITGLFEVVAGILLMFRRTRLLGILMSVIVFTQVLLINIGFDVTMKVFSTLLLWMSFYILTPYLKMLKKIFFSKIPTTIVISSVKSNINWGGYKVYIKTVIILVILLEGNYKAISTFNFNDDLQKRPYANGAYEVDSFAINERELTEQRWSKFYMHRNGYFIIELEDETKKDYKMEFIEGSTTLKITDYDATENFLDFIKKDSLVRIAIPIGEDSLVIKGHQLTY